MGAAVLDADAISRQLTAVGGAPSRRSRFNWGPDVIAADGAMNRDDVRALAF
jgi:dephospho-CoA kinase